MKTTSLLACLLFVVACGGGSTPPVEAPDPEPAATRPAPEEEPEEEPEPPPPPPQEWHARAALAPVKGAKLKAATVHFHQIEDQATRVTAEELPGLKPGTYHLVVHEAAECGKNATKAGPAWEAAAEGVVPVVVAKGTPATLDQGDVALMLDGEASIIGRTLVLHDDKKGKPGKAVGCGVIEAAEPPDDDGGDEDDAFGDE